jgi:fucose permease
MFLLVLIYLSFISLGLPDSLLGSAWPSIYQGLNVPISYAGYVSMIISAGTVLSSLISGTMIHRFKTGLVTAVSVLMTAAALVGFSFSHHFILLCLFAIPLGLGAGSVDAALNNYVALHYKARHMSWLHCFWGIGASIGPVIMSAYLIHHYSWNMGYRTIGIMQFCLVVILFVTIRQWKNATGGGEKDDTRPFNLSKILNIHGVKPVLIGFFCYCTIESTTGLWGASYLLMVKGISAEKAARWISFFYIGITLGRFLSGFITIKLKSAQMVRLGQAVILLGIIILLSPFSSIVGLLGLFTVGLGCAPIYPSLIQETPENFGANNSQSVIGLQMASAYIGTALMPPLFGWIASFTGYNVFAIFIGVVLIVQVAMVETMNKKVSEI